MQKYAFLHHGFILQPAMCSRLVKGESIQQPTEFITVYIKYIILSSRPLEVIFFQTFMPEAEPVTIPVENFDNVALAVTEREQVAR